MITPTDLKGHLLARKANLTQQGQTATFRMLQAEKQLEASRAEVAGLQGACEEIDRTIALIDGGPAS